MYGDTAVIRAMARSMRERAEDLVTDADQLSRCLEETRWSGLAASAMHRVAGEQALRLRCSADAHEGAADALDRHAEEVDRLKDLIAAIAQRADHLLDSAAGGLAGFVARVVPDALGDWADHFEPPPLGSREWLEVRLPSVP